MGKPFSLQSPEQIAKEYGGNKEKIRQAMAMGLVDPTAGVLGGMFIDRMRSAQSLEQGAQPTVAQQVLAPPAPASAPPAPPASGAPPMGMAPPMAPQAPPMAPQAPPMGMASGGLTTLPIPDDMFDEPQYGGGGIVAFAKAGEVGEVESDPFRPSLSPESVARAYKGLTEDPYLSQRDRLANMTTEELTELRRMPPYMREQFGPSFLIEDAIASKVGAEDEARAAQLKIPPMGPIPAAPPFSVEIPRAPPKEQVAPTPSGLDMSLPRPSSEEIKQLGVQQREQLAGRGISLPNLEDLAPAPRKEQVGSPKERVGTRGPRVDPEVTKAVADVAAPQAPAAPEKDYAAHYADAMAAREGYPTLPAGESIADQKKQDFNMALAQMGFGIAAGTSPNALTNIGAGMSGAVPGMQKAMDRRREAQRDADKADFARREAVYGQKNAARAEVLGLLKAGEERKDARAKLAQDASEGALDRRSAESIARERNAAGLANTQAGLGARTGDERILDRLVASGVPLNEAVDMLQSRPADPEAARRTRAIASAANDTEYQRLSLKKGPAAEAAREAIIQRIMALDRGALAAAPAPRAGFSATPIS